MAKKALLIGINYYGTDSELSGCVNDINDVEAFLRLVGYSDFLKLYDEPSDPQHKLPTAPTRANILAALDAAVKSTKAGDTLYVHYSGHGSYIRDSKLVSDEKDGRDEVICPVDFDNGFIADDDLNRVLVGQLDPAAHLRAVFDSCHSGSVLDLPCRWVCSLAGADRWYMENNQNSNKDIVMISGCQDDQTSADSSFDGRANGALTWAFLKSLSDIRKSGRYASSYRWKDLVNMIRLKLRKGQYSQVPQVSFPQKALLSNMVDLV